MRQLKCDKGHSSSTQFNCLRSDQVVFYRSIQSNRFKSNQRQLLRLSQINDDLVLIGFQQIISKLIESDRLR